jgi:hypothetical protein
VVAESKRKEEGVEAEKAEKVSRNNKHEKKQHAPTRRQGHPNTPSKMQRFKEPGPHTPGFLVINREATISSKQPPPTKPIVTRRKIEKAEATMMIDKGPYPSFSPGGILRVPKANQRDL